MQRATRARGSALGCVRGRLSVSFTLLVIARGTPLPVPAGRRRCDRDVKPELAIVLIDNEFQRVNTSDNNYTVYTKQAMGREGRGRRPHPSRSRSMTAYLTPVRR